MAEHVPTATTSARADVSEKAVEIAKNLDTEVRRSYDYAMLCCGQLVVEHDYAFGYLRESTLESEDAVAALLSSAYWVPHLETFQSAVAALDLFNSAFVRLRTVTGLETTGQQLAGYFLRGPTEELLRAVRHALSIKGESRDDADELAARVAENARKLMEAMEIDREDERAAIHEEAKKLEGGHYASLEQVAAQISLASNRRDKRAIAFVALALAGWEPDLKAWEKSIALLIRGERALRGEYSLPVQLDRRVHEDIIVGVSLDRRDTYMTLDGSALRRVENLHIGQDSKGRYVRTTDRPQENMVGPRWAPFERTSFLDWETMKDFVSQTGPVRYEWTSIINRMKGLGRACVRMDGMEVGKAFLSMSDNIKTSTPNLYKIWEKTMSQRSFTPLICGAMTTSAARAAVLERMVLSTVTVSTCYHIDSQSICLRVRDGTAFLVDEEGNQMFVDRNLENIEDSDVAEVGVKFFALLTRAMDGWIIKPGFYKDRARQKSVLRARAPRQAFDRRHEAEAETRAVRAWRQLCESPFGNS